MRISCKKINRRRRSTAMNAEKALRSCRPSSVFIGCKRVFRPLAALVLLLLSVAPGDAQTAPVPPGNGRIESLKGELSLLREARPVRALKVRELVQAGDEIRTGSKSEAVIRTSDGSKVRIFPDSRILFGDGPHGIDCFLHLFLGSIKVRIEKLSGRPNPHTLTTPTAIIAVRGTTFSIFVDKIDATLVAVDEGVVAVSNVRSPGQEILLRRGEKTWVRHGRPPTRAEPFQGPSEHADTAPGRGNAAGPGGGIGGAGRVPGAGARPPGIGGRGGPRH
jgi:ferric-dicitrate binding protein FerR (iron transport regulator)